MKLSKHQQSALLYLDREMREGRRRHPDPSAYRTYGVGNVDARDKRVTLPTARYLAGLGLVDLTTSQSFRTVRASWGWRQRPQTDATVRITFAGEALAKTLS